MSCLQLYFNEHLLAFFEELCSASLAPCIPTADGYSQPTAHSRRRHSLANPSINSSAGAGAGGGAGVSSDPGGKFAQMAVRGTIFNGSTYGDLVTFLLRRGCVPLGLYR